MSRSLFANGSAILAVMFLAACDSIFGGTDRREELAVRHARWIASEIADYDYVRVWNCFCMLGGVQLRVSVRGGAVQSVTFVESGEPVPPSSFPEDESIEGLFDILSTAFDRQAVEVRVRYDPQYGFPVEAWIDYSRNAIDEERGWRIESFTPIR